MEAAIRGNESYITKQYQIKIKDPRFLSAKTLFDSGGRIAVESNQLQASGVVTVI